MLDRRNVSITVLARKEKVDRTYMGRILKLIRLAPQIINAIMEGTQPRLLNLQTITRREIPILWEEQLKLYGF